MNPDSIKEQFSQVLGRDIEKIQPLSGGCSYPAYVVHSQNVPLFVKTSEQPTTVFQREAEGLDQLGDLSDLFPEVIHWDDQHLILDYIHPEAPTEVFWTSLGQGLAELHGQTQDQFGFATDNFIGASQQKNQCSPEITWAEFFWQNRLAFKFQQLEAQGQGHPPDRVEALQKICFEILQNHNCTASPLHGDLWNGNVVCGPGQRPYLIDPAFYFGDAETDLAMSECFGGFTEAFYHAYWSYREPQPGYDTRKHLYNLYHMLNHQVIFGAQYKGAVEQIINTLSS